MTTIESAAPSETSPAPPPRTRRPWRSWILRLVLALALVSAGVGGGIWWEHRANAVTAAGATTRTTLVQATLGTVKQTVAATGTVEPAHQSTQTFSSAGTITAVEVTVGDKVTKGQTLATIDPASLTSAATLAQASVAAAQAQVDSSTSGTSGAASAQAQLASAQQQLASAQQSLAGATLTTPMTGVVASVSYAVGDSVGSGSSGSGSGSGGSGAGGSGAAGSAASAGSSGSTGITVVDTASWQVQATVTSSQLGQLKKGLQATITPSGANQPIFGIVASVGVVASSSSSGTAEFPVVIDVTGNPTGIHAGTTADVAITVKQLTNVLTIPTLAVGTTNGQTTVSVSKNGKTSTVPVTVGGVYGATTQITKGLAAGDEVVVTTRTFAGSGTGTTGRTGTGTRGGFGGGGIGGGTGGGTGRG